MYIYKYIPERERGQRDHGRARVLEESEPWPK